MTRRLAAPLLALLVASLAWVPTTSAACSEPADGLALCETDDDGDGTPETLNASATRNGTRVDATCTGLGQGVTPACTDAILGAETGRDGTGLGATARCGSVSPLGNPCPLDLRARVDALTPAGNASVAAHVRPVFVSVCQEDPATDLPCLP